MKFKDFKYLALYRESHRVPGYDPHDPSETVWTDTYKGFVTEDEMKDWVRRREKTISDPYQICECSPIMLEIEIVVKKKEVK